MNFRQMKTIEPRLILLECHSKHAGRHGVTWQAYAAANRENLGKCVGRGAAVEELQNGHAYETARAALFASWSRGTKQETPTPNPPPFHDGEQTMMFNTAEPYS